MAIETLTFAPGTVATVSRPVSFSIFGGSVGDYVVDAVNAAPVTLTFEIGDDGSVSNAEWDAEFDVPALFVDGFAGSHTGSDSFLFDPTADAPFAFLTEAVSDGLLFSIDPSVTFTVGQNVDALIGGLTNSFDADVSGIICFTPGSLIATPTGPRPVETLAIGDLVITEDRGLQAIRWVGRRRMTGARLRAMPELRPILIPRGSLGPGLPERDMRVSPQHRMLLDGPACRLTHGSDAVLVPAKALLNCAGIAADTGCREVEYVHVLFDRHEIIWADGVRTESFHPGHVAMDSLDAAGRAELLEIFPELAAAPAAYGPTARPAPRMAEARLIGQEVLRAA
ncbi:MAG: Hint domain-containing protein [Pseudomonadota bacterium]